ncbi:hypothetical protein SUGI_0756620 [Cryptomeria japonica]|nr:hypothetical protein SUGI_0756620 [Cryptomeria japonica]
MAAKGSGKDKPAASAAPKKANLLDPHAIKHLLDETASEVVFSRGYAENVTLSNVKMVIGIIIISIALAAQFYPKKFPENRNFLIICIVLYPFIIHSSYIQRRRILFCQQILFLDHLPAQVWQFLQSFLDVLTCTQYAYLAPILSLFLQIHPWSLLKVLQNGLLKMVFWLRVFSGKM